MHLDQVLRLSTDAVFRFIDPFRVQLVQRRDHVPPIDVGPPLPAVPCPAPRAQRPADDAELADPRQGAVGEFAVGAADVADVRPARLGRPRGDLRNLLQAVEAAVLREAEDEVDALLPFAPLHDFPAGEMGVAAQNDPGVRPMPADARNQSSQMPENLLARRRLRRTQSHGNHGTGLDVVDVELIAPPSSSSLKLGDRGGRVVSFS